MLELYETAKPKQFLRNGKMNVFDIVIKSDSH